MAIDNPGEENRFQPPFYSGSFEAQPLPLSDDLISNYQARHVLPDDETLQLFLPPGVVPPPDEQLGAHAYERREIPFGFRRFVGLEPTFPGEPPIEYSAVTGARFQEMVNGQNGVLDRYQLFADTEHEARSSADGVRESNARSVYLEHESVHGTVELRLTQHNLDAHFYAADGGQTEARYVHDQARGIVYREVLSGDGRQRFVPVSVDEAVYVIDDLLANAKPAIKSYDQLAATICEETISNRPPLSSAEAWQANYLLQQVTKVYRTAALSVEDFMSGASELRRVIQAENGDLVSVVIDVMQPGAKSSAVPEYCIALNHTAHSRDHDLTGALAMRQHVLPSDGPVGGMTLYDRMWLYPSTAGPECVLDSRLIEDGSERVLSERRYRLNAPPNVIQVLRNHVLGGRVLDGVMP